jgi:hypothetical protein
MATPRRLPLMTLGGHSWSVIVAVLAMALLTMLFVSLGG